MTQFVLCNPQPLFAIDGNELRLVSYERSLLEPAWALFPTGATVFIPHLTSGESMDDRFTEAQHAAWEAKDSETTRLGSLPPKLARSCRLHAIWWASDGNDLPVARSIESLRTEVRRQLQSPVGDVYVLARLDQPDVPEPERP